METLSSPNRMYKILFGLGSFITLAALKEMAIDIVQVTDDTMVPIIEKGDIIITSKFLNPNEMKGKVVLFTEPQLN